MGVVTRLGLYMLWTTEAPARSETKTATHDLPSEGVPVGCFPAPNFLFISGFQKTGSGTAICRFELFLLSPNNSTKMDHRLGRYLGLRMIGFWPKIRSEFPPQVLYPTCLN